MGRPIERFIPMKVPLGARFDSHIAPEHRFTIDDAVAQARKVVGAMTLDVMLPPPPDAQPGPEGQPPAPKRSKVPAVLGLVIDLTNSSRYYDARQWHERGVQYIKASGGVAAAGWAGRRKPSRAGSWCACLAADQRASGCDAVFDGKGASASAGQHVTALHTPGGACTPPPGPLPRAPPRSQIPCRGRGAAPPPEAVTDLCWEMYAYLQQCPQGMALIHCTHGFNRTGYMVASYLARMMSWTVPKALDAFAHKRPPGIYKHYYIRLGRVNGVQGRWQVVCGGRPWTDVPLPCCCRCFLCMMHRCCHQLPARPACFFSLPVPPVVLQGAVQVLP